MQLAIREIHAATEPNLINQEWILIENVGPTPIHTGGLRLTVQGPKSRPRDVGVMEPGFPLAPGAKQRIVSGSPGRKSLGAAPDDQTPNYYLFLKVGYLERADLVVRIARNQVELAQAVFDPSNASGIRTA